MLGSSSLGKLFFSRFMITVLHDDYDAVSLVTYFFSLTLSVPHCATRGLWEVGIFGKKNGRRQQVLKDCSEDEKSLWSLKWMWVRLSHRERRRCLTQENSHGSLPLVL
jgi:hypothetical protein